LSIAIAPPAPPHREPMIEAGASETRNGSFDNRKDMPQSEDDDRLSSDG
jgi:hypothetical protein